MCGYTTNLDGKTYATLLTIQDDISVFQRLETLTPLLQVVTTLAYSFLIYVPSLATAAQLFTRSGIRPLCDMFVIDYSAEGSNARTDQENSLFEFSLFLGACQKGRR
jgi:hypothetical protein